MNTKLPAFRITLSDGSSYVTSMTEKVTLQDAKDYFLGGWFTQADEMTRLQVVKVE